MISDRKFKWSVGCGVVATVFTATSILTGDQWVNVTVMLTGLYVAGNLGEHYVKKEGTSNVSE